MKNMRKGIASSSRGPVKAVQVLAVGALVAMAAFSTACSAGSSDPSTSAAEGQVASTGEEALAAEASSVQSSGLGQDDGASASSTGPSSASSAESSSVSVQPTFFAREQSEALKRLGDDALDDKGNLTLRALFELDGDDIQHVLEEGEYAWHDSARAWTLPSGAAFEAQNANGLLDRGALSRLDGAAGTSRAAYLVTVAGYETRDEALFGLSDGVVVLDTCELPEDEALVALVCDEDSKVGADVVDGIITVEDWLDDIAYASWTLADGNDWGIGGTAFEAEGESVDETDAVAGEGQASRSHAAGGRGHAGDDGVCLVVVTEIARGVHSLVVLSEQAVEEGMYAEVIGVKPAKSVRGIWKKLTEPAVDVGVAEEGEVDADAAQMDEPDSSKDGLGQAETGEDAVKDGEATKAR